MFFNPFASVRMRYLSVSCSVNAFLVRWCPFNPVESVVHAHNFPADGTDTNGQRRPPGVRLLSIRHVFLFGARALFVLYLSDRIR